MSPFTDAEGTPWSWSHVVNGLRGDPEVRRRLTRSIADAPWDGIFWETSPSHRDIPHLPYRQVLIDSPAVAGLQADPRPFGPHLDTADDIVCFPNLSGDARLVVPVARDDAEHYAHLATFVRGAPAAQVDRLWQRVGEEVAEWWIRSPAPVWVSTSGLGVPWLHVRISSVPKYYTHAPFRAVPEE